jgi:hypothetical protein
MTPADVDRALAILKRWKSAAKLKRNSTAEADVGHVEKVLLDLTGRKYVAAVNTRNRKDARRIFEQLWKEA